jgi:hypothetical protein
MIPEIAVMGKYVFEFNIMIDTAETNVEINVKEDNRRRKEPACLFGQERRQ